MATMPTLDTDQDDDAIAAIQRARRAAGVLPGANPTTPAQQATQPNTQPNTTPAQPATATAVSKPMVQSPTAVQPAPVATGGNPPPLPAAPGGYGVGGSTTLPPAKPVTPQPAAPAAAVTQQMWDTASSRIADDDALGALVRGGATDDDIMARLGPLQWQVEQQNNAGREPMTFMNEQQSNDSLLRRIAALRSGGNGSNVLGGDPANGMAVIQDGSATQFGGTNPGAQQAILAAISAQGGAAPAGPAAGGGGGLPPSPDADGMQPFGPGNDLRSTQIAAPADEFDAVAPGNFALSDEAGRARGLSLDALEKMQNGPDRLQLAMRAMDLARKQSQEGFDQDVRKVGQNAAAFGRMGSGVVNRNLADLATQRERDLGNTSERLIMDALDNTMGDRQGLLSAALNASGQFRGEDLDVGGFQQGLRNEARTERTDRLGYNSRSRDELRGERSFQNDMSQQALMDFIRMTQLQEGVADSQFGRDQARLNSIIMAAFGGDGDLTNTLLNAAGGFD
jgi:hypothetical protein